MDVEFITSAPNLAGRPELVLPEIAFIGRSNCGKSSLINHLLDRKKMAKTSGKPGKTRLLNYFAVEKRYYIVDLPGYGFAKVSKVMRQEWARLIRGYLGAGDRPLAVFMLLDARRKPSEDDLEMLHWLQDSGHPYAIAVTKIDKIGTNIKIGRYREIAETLDLPADTPFFPTSATSRQGAKEMRAWINALLESAEE